jgi:hypothetical protein
MADRVTTTARPRPPSGIFLVAVATLACCGEEYGGRVVSADQRYEAAVVEHNCGATTGYVTFVRLTDRTAVLLQSQDIMMIEGSSQLRLTWAGPRKLTVEYPPGRPPNPSQTHGPPARWEDVDIVIREWAR